jgi:hypothetical protein
MPTIAEAATVIPMKQRTRATTPWAEFEPYWNQLRSGLDTSENEACKAIGYTGSNIAFWKKEGVPTVALYAIRWVLHERRLDAPQPKRKGPSPVVFTLDQLSTLFDMVRNRSIPDGERRAFVKLLAQAIAQADG